MVDLSACLPIKWGWIVIIVLSSSTCLPAEPPQLAVSSFAMDALTLTPPTSQDIAASLRNDTWCSAVAADSKRAWNEVPAGVDRSQWVSVVTVGFQGQAEVYAFMFDGPDGAVSMVTHVPFREVWTAAGVATWIWPTDSALGALRLSYRDRQQQPAKRLLKLNVVPWEEKGSEAPAIAKTPNLEDAQTLAPELVYPPVTVMAHAAAFEAGWMPTAAEAPWTATCQIRVEDQACSFKLTLRGEDSEQTLTKLHVPWETYHEHLVRLFRLVESSRGVSDFTQLSRHPLELLTLSEGQLACLVNHELTVFDVKTGKKSWTTEPSVKPANYQPAPQYTGWPTAPAAGKQRNPGPRLLRYRPNLGEFEWATGKIKPLSTTWADLRHGVSTDHADVWTTANGGVLSLVQAGTTVWEHKELEAITAGPQLIADQVVYGQASGRLVSRAIRDGKLLWQQRLPSSPYGKIVPFDTSFLTFSNATETVLAVDAAQGKLLWQCPVGDVLLETPRIIGQQVLLVTKGNRLLLLDTASGKIQKDVHWPTWLVSASLVDSQPEPLLACGDLSGTVTLLSLNDLQPMRTIAVGSQLSGPILYAQKVSYNWPVKQAAESDENLLAEIQDGPTRSGPALLAADAQGFLYILPLSSSE